MKNADFEVNNDINIPDEGMAFLDGFEIPIECIYFSLQHEESLSRIHYHNYIELLYGIDCDAEIWYNGKTFHLKSGDLIVITSKKPHTVRSIAPKSTYIVIKFLPQILYAAEQSVFEFKYIIPFIADDDRYSKLFFKADTENSEIPHIMNTILDEWNCRSYGYEIALRVCVIKIALWLIRRWHTETGENALEAINATDAAISSVQRSIEYAQKNYSTATSNEAARLCSLSYSYFSRLFKRVMNKSFTEYVNEIRISESERLLVTTNKSITNIALDVGFSTTSYFIERFKKQIHLTPKQFRTNYQIKP